MTPRLLVYLFPFPFGNCTTVFCVCGRSSMPAVLISFSLFEHSSNSLCPESVFRPLLPYTCNPTPATPIAGVAVGVGISQI